MEMVLTEARLRSEVLMGNSWGCLLCFGQAYEPTVCAIDPPIAAEIRDSIFREVKADMSLYFRRTESSP